jgi:hypothetical protein
LSDREKAIRADLRDDLIHYATKCLKIRAKSKAIVPLTFNRVQLYLHQKLEEQRLRTGRVRAMVLKGRQEGCSTYVGARFYHKATHQRGVRVFILTHEQSATDTLFEMVERYHAHCPTLVRPSTGNANAKELFFDKLDSGYQIGTAGTKAVGRSKTIQLFHGSEVAFWPNAGAHFAGVVQAIPDQPDTEIILETTANGVGGDFHSRWQQAEARQGDYEAIFIPWHWDADYRRDVPEGFRLDAAETDYAEVHGLDLGQMVWRRAKMAELKDPLLFMQEYPATAAEAFQGIGHDSYIKPELILKARKAKTVEAIGLLVLGVDPKRFGDDRFSIAWRKGRKVEKVESRTGAIDNVAGATWVRQVIQQDKPARVFIDVGGQGAGVYDVLVSWGLGEEHQGPVRAVDFGGSPMEPKLLSATGEEIPGPRNRRVEMWMRSKDWLSGVAPVSIPDSDALQADACAPGYTYDMNQQLVLDSKEKMRKAGIRSPDEWDAVALTFAEPVADVKPARVPERKRAGGWAA